MVICLGNSGDASIFWDGFTEGAMQGNPGLASVTWLEVMQLILALWANCLKLHYEFYFIR
jgi:hypothetical protein